MRFKAAFVAGFCAGYVLGTRAGRQRYEQIVRMSRSLSKRPAVRHSADAVQSQAAHLGNQALRAMQDKAGSVGHDLFDMVVAKLPGGLSERLGHHEIDLAHESAYSDGTMT